MRLTDEVSWSAMVHAFMPLGRPHFVRSCPECVRWPGGCYVTTMSKTPDRMTRLLAGLLPHAPPEA